MTAPRYTPFDAWFREHGYVWDEKRDRWCIAWSCRDGYDFTDLEFKRLNERLPERWLAVLGHHQSGENPRMLIGQCDTVKDVSRLHTAIRLVNGYDMEAK